MFIVMDMTSKLQLSNVQYFGMFLQIQMVKLIQTKKNKNAISKISILLPMDFVVMNILLLMMFLRK